MLEIVRDFQIFPNLPLIADAKPIRRFTPFCCTLPGFCDLTTYYANSLTCSSSCSSSSTFIRSQLFPIVTTFILGQGAWLTPRNTPLPHLSYRAEFGRCTSNHMSVNKVGPKILGTLAPSLRTRACLTSRNMPLSYIIMPNLVALVRTMCVSKVSHSVSQVRVVFAVVTTALHCKRHCARENVSLRDMPVSEEM